MIEKIKELAKELLAIWKEPAVALLPAHLAYFTVLSLVPILMIIFFGAQYFSLPIEKLMAPLESTVPDAVSSLLAPAEETASNLSVGIWLVVALFVGSNGMNAVMLGSDSLYGFDTKNPITKRLKAILLTFLLVILILLGVAIIGLSEFLIGSITGGLHEVISILRWILVALLAFAGVKYIYMVTPQKRMLSKYTNRGSLVTVTGWILASIIYTFYYTNFSNYSELYGALANIIVLMIFVYILVMIFVFGMIVNVYQYQKDNPSHTAIEEEKESTETTDEALET